MAILNPALKGFFEADYRYYVLYGGRASSKTYHTAGFLALLASEYSIRVLCARQFQARIDESVKQVIEEAIESAGLLNDYKITDTSIVHRITGSEFIFYGIQRNLREIKGLASIDILWIEECESLTKEQWDVIMPTVRDEGSRIFLVFNPRYASDFVWQNFVVNQQPKSNVRQINYDENPYLSVTMREVIEDCRNTNIDDYNHIYGGVPLQDDESAIIRSEWIEAAIDADIKMDIGIAGVRKGALDVADEGKDKNCFAGRHGILLEFIEEWSGIGSDIQQTAEKAALICDEHQYTTFDYDSDGLGVGVRGDIRLINVRREINGEAQINAVAFRGSSSPIRPDAQDFEGRKNKDLFANLKAQGWWMLRRRFQLTYRYIVDGIEPASMDDLISIRGNLPMIIRLKAELAQPKRIFTPAGKIQVDKSPGGTKSPNLADAVMMLFAKSDSEKKKNVDVHVTHKGIIYGHAEGNSWMI